MIPAPFDVRLPKGDERQEDIENIVQPDGKYGRPGIYSESDTVPLNILNDVKVDLISVFSITID